MSGRPGTRSARSEPSSRRRRLCPRGPCRSPMSGTRAAPRSAAPCRAAPERRRPQPRRTRRRLGARSAAGQNYCNQEIIARIMTSTGRARVCERLPQCLTVGEVPHQTERGHPRTIGVHRMQSLPHRSRPRWRADGQRACGRTTGPGAAPSVCGRGQRARRQPSGIRVEPIHQHVEAGARRGNTGPRFKSPVAVVENDGIRVELETTADAAEPVPEFDVLLPSEARVEAADREEVLTAQPDVAGVQVRPHRCGDPFRSRTYSRANRSASQWFHTESRCPGGGRIGPSDTTGRFDRVSAARWRAISSGTPSNRHRATPRSAPRMRRRRGCGSALARWMSRCAKSGPQTIAEMLRH